MIDFIVRFLKILIVFGLVAVFILLVPEVCAFWAGIVEWIVGLGTWGTILIVGSLLYAVMSIFLD